jgi:hypothetical protein
VEVGSMSISFASNFRATLTYALDGVFVSKEIQPQIFGLTVPVCNETTASRAALTNYQDLWWNSGEPGWGLNLTHQSNTIFATLFSYNSVGSAEWYVASGLERQANGTFSGPLYRTTGPPFYASPWTAATAAQVGLMVLSFADGDSGTVSYSINGASVTKPIDRQVFSSPQSLCR